MLEPIKKQVGQRIRARRVAADLTQRELGDLADIDATQLGKYERGITDVSVTNLVRIAGAFGVDPGLFVEDIGRESLPAYDGALETVPEYLARRERQGGKPTRRGRNSR